MEPLILKKALRADLPKVLTLQKKCYQSEAALYNDYSIQPLTQTLEELYADFNAGERCIIALRDTEIVGAVRGVVKKNIGYIGKLIVHPDFQNKGIGKRLLAAMETVLEPVACYELFTGHKSEKNVALYQRQGYFIFKQQPVNDQLTLFFLRKKFVKES